MLKFCLASIGVMIGVLLPRDKKKTVLFVASVLFAVTYVPLMTKFFRIVLESREK